MAGVLERDGQAGWGLLPQAERLHHGPGVSLPTSEAQWGLSHRILGSCTGLMQAIHVLVLASKDLQREIVESGRVSWGLGCRKGCGQGMGQQVLGQLRVTTHLLGTCCSEPWPAGGSTPAAGSSCPSPSVSLRLQSPGCHRGP